jgi:SpoVK/Ycf46/Vps4 family AAA+-type ATPase
MKVGVKTPVKDQIMNSDLLMRMFRAISEESLPTLNELAISIVEQERRVGHTKLASELDSIIKSKRKQQMLKPSMLRQPELSQLPLSRRYGEELVTLIPREQLEHHMVLPTEVEERFQRIEKEYAARERLGAFGLRNRKTILLYGLPGCGKSLGAKRIAWNTGLPLLKVRFDSLLSSYFGESATNLRQVFEAAKARPSVLLLDECDFIARSRTDSRDIGEASRVVNSLLQEMESFNAPGMLVATTNIEDSLDDALFRRFDDVFQVPPPGPIEIERLLETTLSSIKVSDRVRWPSFVEKLAGNSAATIVKAAQDAAKAAVLDGEKVVSEKHLSKAIKELRRSTKESR